MKTDVTRVLVEEHQLILRMIALVEANVARMETGRFRDWRFFFDAVDFIRNYADRFHHAKEEDVLFGVLERAKAYAAIVQVIRFPITAPAHMRIEFTKNRPKDVPA